MDDEDHVSAPPPPPLLPSAPRHGAAKKAAGKQARRLGLAPPPSAMAGDATGAAQGPGNAQAAANAGRKRPPLDPSTANAKRKGRQTSTAQVASMARGDQTTPCSQVVSNVPLAAYSTPPAYSGLSSSSPTADMPESVDDDTFLNIMDGENFSVDPDLGFDQYNDADSSENELEMTKKRGGRGANFTIAEDETLVKAWQAITLDPITRDEQPGGTYWKRIHEHFCQHNKSGIHRSQHSVSHRWQAIAAACTKWASCLLQVERLNPSGADAADKVNIAQRLYKGKPKKKGGKPGKAFGLQHCWVLLQHDEKWRTRNDDVPTKSKKSSNSCSPVDVDDEDVDDEDVSDSDRARSPTPNSARSSKRPAGRKAEKERLKKGGEGAYKESLDNMVTTRKELAADRKEYKNVCWKEMKEVEDRKAVAEEKRAAAEDRRAAAEERRAAAEEQRAAIEERRVAAEERRLAAEEASKRLEQEQKIMFMDGSNLDEKGKAYLDIMKNQVLEAHSMGGFYMGGFMGGGCFGANGGNGSSFAAGGNGANEDSFAVGGGNGANASSTDNGAGGSE